MEVLFWQVGEHRVRDLREVRCAFLEMEMDEWGEDSGSNRADRTIASFEVG